MTNLSPEPPNDFDAEMAVLGAVLQDNKVLDDVMDLVKAEDFYRPSHGIIFDTMVNMRVRSLPIDAITLRVELQNKGALEKVGGGEYLLDISGHGMPYSSKRYAQQVRNCAKLRAIISIGKQMEAFGYEGSRDDDGVNGVIGDSLSMVTSLALAHQSSSIPIGQSLDRLMRNMRSGARDWFTPPGMDKARLKPGDFVIVAAPTSAGKTALSLNWADEWSKTKQVVYFEYEMADTELSARLICNHAGVDLYSIQDGKLNQEEEQRVEDAAHMLSERKLRIEEIWCDMGSLCAKIRQEAQRGTEVVFIDHIGLIPFKRPKGMNEAKALGACVTNVLKRLASELSITIVGLVQLNREGQKGSFYPKLYHLRDSGEFEQDASVVFMMWSEKAILDDASDRIRKREESGLFDDPTLLSDDELAVRIEVAKNRNGMLFHTWAKFNGSRFRYEYLDKSAGQSVVQQVELS